MITLQSSISFADGADPPLDVATISVSFPRFSLSGTLSIVGQSSVDFEQQLSSNRYQIAIPTSALFGPDYGPAVANYFTSLLQDGRKLRLRDVSATFSFSYGGNSAKADIEALYFLKQLSRRESENDAEPIVPRIASIPLMADRPLSNAAVTDLIERNIYAVNKVAYRELLESLFSGLDPENDSILLYVINRLVDLTNPAPQPIQDPDDKAVEAVLRSFGWEPDDAPAIRNAILQNFDKLFDFPVNLPKVTLLSIAGVVGLDESEPKFSDLTLCSLSAELSISGRPIIARYQWDERKFRDGKVDFVFPEKYILDSVRGMVAIKVMAFDNSSLYFAEFKPSDPTLQRLDIKITPKRPSVLKPLPMKPATPTKLRGQLVSLAPKPPESLQGTVVIQGRKIAKGDWITLVSAASDRVGNFSMPFPSGTHAEARALVSLDPENITPITVTDDLISSDFIYILLKNHEKEPEEKRADCKCEQQNVTGRLPSQDDLIQSDQYTQDIGGTCMNLNTPNRTLQEYNYTAIVRTSDPDVANYSVRSATDDKGSRTFLMANHGKVNREFIDLNNPVRWQDDEDDAEVTITNWQIGSRPIFRNPVFSNPFFNRKPEVSTQLYQAVTVATGHILHYKSEFKADGYSLGDLLYSVPLAPGQKKQIVIFDAGHSFTGSENQAVSQAEELANSLLNERSIVDKIAGNIGELTRGQSEASTWGVSGAVGASGSSGFIGASAGVAGGYSNASSSAAQDSSRNLSQYFGEMLRQSLNQNASSYRKLTASAVTTVKEGQQYNAETTVISNHNHCHSLTMMYFEVLRHFAVFQELVDVEECVFVPFLMTKFTAVNVCKWADVLVTKLLPLHSNTYLTPYTHPTSRFQHPLIPAFDAAERIRTKYTMVDYPEGSYDQEPIRKVEGNMVVHVELPRPKTKYDFILSLPIVKKTISREVTDAGDAIKSIIVGGFNPLSWLDGPETHTETQEVIVKKQIFDNFMTMDETYESVPPAQCIRVFKFAEFNITGLFSGRMNPLDFIGMSPRDLNLWRMYAHCLDFSPGDFGVLEMLQLYFQGQLLCDWDRIFQSEIAPGVFRHMMSTVNFDVIPVKMTVDTKYNGGERYINANFSGNPSIKRAVVQGVTLGSSDTTIRLVKESVIFNIETLRIAYSTNHFQGLLYNGRPTGDLLSGGVYIDTPETWDEKRDPRKEDGFIVNRLVEHLNFNLEYYNRMLWYSLDAERRWLLLDGFNIQTFDKQGNPEAYRSLSSVLKNNLIAVTGNSLVFPVAPGFSVNRALIVADGEQQESLLEHYKPKFPSPPYRISVPTRGVYMESVMGSCDSCEKVKPDSSQDWTRFTTDEPTPIAQVTPPVPTVTPYQAAFEKLANPLISIQNAPAAPDPGAGLAAATDLLGKTGLFKDITGLDANQANAIRTYLSNNDNVRAIASMASSLAAQAHNTANSAMIMDTMGSANDRGVLSDEDYGKLVKQHLQQQIDGGAAAKAEAESDKAAQSESLEDAAVQAVKDGKEVKAVKTDGEGNTNSIDVKGLVGFAVSGETVDGASGGGGAGTFNVGKEEHDMVEAFKKTFRTSSDNGSGNEFKTPNILYSGQFQITDPLEADIMAIVDASIDADPDSGSLRDVWKQAKAGPKGIVNPANTDTIKDYIDQHHLESKHPNIVKLFKKSNADLWEIRDIYHDFWVTEAVQASPKVPVPTFNKLKLAYEYEQDKCGYTTQLLAQKYWALKNRPKNKKPLDVVLPAKLDPPSLPDRSPAPQTLKYTAKALSTHVQAVRDSIAAGRPVIAGVVSGVNRAGVVPGSKATEAPFSTANPLPEHYIMIFGCKDDRFVFWDSDDTVSDIGLPGLKPGEKSWGASFGMLFARDDRFSTAFNEDDFNGIDAAGEHRLVPKRHRYQVNYVKNSYAVDLQKDLGWVPKKDRH